MGETSVLVSPDGETVISVDVAGTIFLWTTLPAYLHRFSSYKECSHAVYPDKMKIDQPANTLTRPTLGNKILIAGQRAPDFHPRYTIH